MPLTYEVDHENRMVRARGSGALTMDELVGYLSTTRADPEVEPGMHRFMDLREVTTLPSSEDIRQLATVSRNNAPGQEARMAILASSDLAFGVSMMFKAFAGFGERLIVVREEDEAMRWLTSGG